MFSLGNRISKGTGVENLGVICLQPLVEPLRDGITKGIPMEIDTKDRTQRAPHV